MFLQNFYSESYHLFSLQCIYVVEIPTFILDWNFILRAKIILSVFLIYIVWSITIFLQRKIYMLKHFSCIVLYKSSWVINKALQVQCNLGVPLGLATAYCFCYPILETYWKCIYSLSYLIYSLYLNSSLKCNVVKSNIQ